MGYKKQSKRKSPFKQTAYGSHKDYGVRFDRLETANVSNNRLGQAVGAIGTSIGDAVEEFKAEKENKDVEAIAATREATDKAAGAAFGGDPFAFENPPASKLPTIGKLKERASSGKLTKTYDIVGADAEQKALNDGLDATAAKAAGEKAIADAKSYNKTKYGTESPTAAGKTNNLISIGTTVPGTYIPGTTQATEGSTADPSIKGSGVGYDEIIRRDAPLPRSPFKRMTPFLRSPFYATKGKKLGELAQSSLTNISYLGDIGKAGAEGYNSQVDRHNYAQAVREEQSAELDEEFGELEVPPTGFKPYDASVEGLARGWKTEFVDAKKAWKAGKMSNEDWIDTKHRLQNNASEYALGAENLKKSISSWVENKDNISESTKPEIIDFFNTMEKAPDSLEVQDIDGVATFIGTTLAGKPISMPVSKIANGTAAMRFNTKVDIGAELAPTLKDIQSLKTDMQTQFGIGQGNLDFNNPAIQQRVDFNLDKIVNNNAKLRAIAADTYGWDYDTYEERIAAEGQDAVKAMIKKELKDDIRDSYFPTQKTSKYNVDINQAQQRIDNTKIKKTTKGTFDPENFQAEVSNINKELDTLGAEGGDLTATLGLGKQVDDFGNGEYYIGDQKVSRQQLINLYLKKKGFKQKDIDGALPRSPFKRIMDFFRGPK